MLDTFHRSRTATEQTHLPRLLSSLVASCSAALDVRSLVCFLCLMLVLTYIGGFTSSPAIDIENGRKGPYSVFGGYVEVACERKGTTLRKR